MAKATAHKNLNIFAERLGELIREKGCTHEAVANAAGVTRQGVGKWVSGESIPDVLTAAAVARFFRVSVDYLSGNSDVRSTDTNLKAICDYTGLSEKSVKLCSKLNEYKAVHNDFIDLRSNIKEANDENYRGSPFKIEVISAIIETLDSYGAMLDAISDASAVDLNDDYEEEIEDELHRLYDKNNSPENMSVLEKITDNGKILYGYKYKRFLVQSALNESTHFVQEVINRLTPQEYLYRDENGELSDVKLDVMHEEYSVGLYNLACSDISGQMSAFLMCAALIAHNMAETVKPFDKTALKMLSQAENIQTPIEFYKFIEEWRDRYGVNKTKKE